MQSERPKNLVKRHWKEIRPSNQRLTPSTGVAVSEAKVILPGRLELHMSGAAKFLGFLPIVSKESLNYVVFAIFGVVGPEPGGDQSAAAGES